MLTLLTAHTFEIDEAEAAIAEIHEQLDLANKKMQHAVGVMACYPEFLDSGVAKAICDSLPFDVVGTTTMASGTSGDRGTMMFALSVITSDTVSFTAVVTDSLADDHVAPIAAAYNKAIAAQPEAPSMVLAFAPVMNYLSGDVIIETLNNISGDLPMFGTLPSDHTNDYSQTFVIFNGEKYDSSMAMAFLTGPITPKFYVVSIPEEKRQKQNAIITSSEGNVLHRVNDMPLLNYLETLGLADSSSVDTAKIVPFIVDYNDGTTPVVRGIYRFTPEGSAMCGGLMPLHSTLSVGYIDHDDVVSSTKELIQTIMTESKPQMMLVISCICRGWALGMDVLAEMEIVEEESQGVPYLMSYSGGEICPVYNEKRQTFNRFHNYTCVICTL